MNARELELAATELQRKRRFAREAAVLAILTGMAALVVLSSSLRLAGALAIGAGLELLFAAGALHSRRERISRLALDSTAYHLPEVDRYGSRLVRPNERERLAAWIREVVAEAHLPGSLYLPDRVARFARELEALARDLASSAARVQPASVVACRRLLTHAPESPLYNPRLSAEELASALRRIRGGIAVS